MMIVPTELESAHRVGECSPSQIAGFGYHTIITMVNCNSRRSWSSRSVEILERPFMFCSAANTRRISSGTDAEAGRQTAVRQQLEAAAREDRLDFLMAARILFSSPSRPRKFGLDFHLWQFFVSLLPPFAVYLTAQYARYEMRRMEKERDEKEQLKVQAAMAEEQAAKSMEEESKQSSFETAQSDLMQQEQKDDSKAKAKTKDEPVVVLPEKDFIAMKARLDAMEVKVADDSFQKRISILYRTGVLACP
ncbi:unnamed protein product [Calypogeia fissa]